MWEMHTLVYYAFQVLLGSHCTTVAMWSHTAIVTGCHWALSQTTLNHYVAGVTTHDAHIRKHTRKNTLTHTLKRAYSHTHIHTHMETRDGRYWKFCIQLLWSKNITIVPIIAIIIILLKHDCKYIKLFLNVHKIGKTCRDNYHNIGRLLPLTIIVGSKNWTILIIVKENITVNR